MLDYRFKNPVLRRTALTHRSYSADHNERLEFLGDSLLNCIIAEALYIQYPQAAEGELSRLRARFVKEETLADIARQMQLGTELKLGVGELRSGGADRDSLLADAFEALIAAIFLDSDILQCKHYVLQCFEAKFHDKTLLNNTKDAKTQLQEYLQLNRKSLPIYEIIAADGKHHEQQFTIRCRVPGFTHETFATSSNRRKAEQIAAQDFLVALQVS